MAAAAAAFAATMTLSSASPASANRIEYTYDLCSSNVGACMGLFYYGPNKGGVIHSACFLTNRSIVDHWGRTVHGVTTRYEFRNQPGHDIIRFRLGVDTACWPTYYGSGSELKNAAAAVANQDWVAHDVFVNSYYEGYGVRVPQDFLGRFPVLLRNNNASSYREDR